MDLVTTKPVLKTLLATLSGLNEATAVFWRDQPRPFLPDIALLPRLTSRAFRLNSRDEKRYPHDEDADLGEELTETQNEERQATLSIRCEALSQVDGVTAYDVLERVRSGFQRSSTAATLNAAGMAYVGLLSFVDLTEAQPIDQRDRSIAVLDISIRFGACTPGDKLGYIATYELTQKE